MCGVNCTLCGVAEALHATRKDHNRHRFVFPVTRNGYVQISSLSASTSGVLPSIKGFCLSSACNFFTSTCCTVCCASIAMHAAAAPDCASTMNTGSMRIEPYAIWLALKHTGTYRFLHSVSFGMSRTVRNRIRPEATFLHIAFILYHAIYHKPLTIVRVHRVCSHAHTIGYGCTAFAVGLRHYIITDHAAAFAYVSLRTNNCYYPCTHLSGNPIAAFHCAIPPAYVHHDL